MNEVSLHQVLVISIIVNVKGDCYRCYFAFWKGENILVYQPSLECSIKFLSVYHQSFGKTFFQFILLPLLNNFPSFTPSKLKIKMMMHNVQILLWWFKRICFYRCYCFKVCKTNIDIFLKFYFQIFLSDLV